MTDEITEGTSKSGVIVQPSEKRRGTSNATRTLLILTGVALLVNYVETMVIPGVPDIQKFFSTTPTIAAWITSAYLIVGSAISPLFGKLGDVYGKKRMFMLSLVFYVSGVGIAGFSPSIYVLIAARALQGIGFAIIPLGLAIVTDVFPRERVATAQGIISGTFAIGAALGLVIGSYVVQDLGWQYAFHTALVLSIVLFVVTYKVLQNDTPKGIRKAIDYPGAGILMGGITLLLLYATEGPTLGWFVPEELAFLIVGAALFIGFFFFENKKTNPMISLPLLKIRNVLVANLVGIISGISMFSLFFALIYYTQYPTPVGLGLSIIASGLTLAPSTMGMLVGGPLVGRLTQRSGPKPVLLIGAALSLIGFSLFVFNRTNTFDVALDMVVALAGVVSLIVPIVNMLAISLPPENIAVGLGMNTMLRNLGGAIGPVVATVIMTTYTVKVLVHSPNGALVPVAFPTASAFDYVFEIGIGLMLLVVAISLTVKNYTFRKDVKPV